MTPFFRNKHLIDNKTCKRTKWCIVQRKIEKRQLIILMGSVSIMIGKCCQVLKSQDLDLISIPTSTGNVNAKIHTVHFGSVYFYNTKCLYHCTNKLMNILYYVSINRLFNFICKINPFIKTKIIRFHKLMMCAIYKTSSSKMY